MAGERNKDICKIEYFTKYRANEKESKTKIISPEALQKKWERNLEEGKHDYPGDLFYYPGELFDIISMEKKYFDNDLAEKYFTRLLMMNAGIIQKPFSITELRGYLMAIKKVFYLLSKNIYLPYETITFLIHWLFQFVDTINIKLHELEKEEKTRERNSQNASTWTPAKIEEYKKHDLYPQLEEMIKSCQGTPREIRNLNKIVGKILNIENRVTIRRYRHLFFQEIQK